MMECFRNHVGEIRQKEAFSLLFKKFLDNLGSWVHTAKVYSILHCTLQDLQLMRSIAAEIHERENLLYCYARRPDVSDYSYLPVI